MQEKKSAAAPILFSLLLDVPMMGFCYRSRSAAKSSAKKRESGLQAWKETSYDVRAIYEALNEKKILFPELALCSVVITKGEITQILTEAALQLSVISYIFRPQTVYGMAEAMVQEIILYTRKELSDHMLPARIF